MPKLIIYSLPDKIKEKYAVFVDQFKSFDLYKKPEQLAQILSYKLMSLLPSELVETLKNMRRKGTPDIIVIRNLPIDNPIPAGKKDLGVEARLREKGKISESTILGIANLMGQRLHSSPKEQNGRIVHNVHPLPGQEQKVSSKGKASFYLHTESPYEKSPPNFLMLLCLEGDQQTKTTFYYVDNFIKKLSQETIKNAQLPEFEFSSGDSYDQKEVIETPLIAKDKNQSLRFRIFQETSRIKPSTERAKKVLEDIEAGFKTIEDKQEIEGFCLQPGDAILFNNGWGVNQLAGVMHGRDTVKNPFRWLQRGFFFDQDKDLQTKLVQEQGQTLLWALTSKQCNLSEAASMLRETMLRSSDCQNYKNKNPNATNAQVLLYGTKPLTTPLLKKNSWLKRIVAQGANFPDDAACESKLTPTTPVSKL